MYDEDHHKTIAQLISHIGSQEKCLRLGFLATDDNATLHLSPAGTGSGPDAPVGMAQDEQG